MSIDFQCLIGPAARAILDEEHVDLYLQIHAEPPYLSGPLYSRERFTERTGRQLERDGFSLVSARSGAELVGFAFGLGFEAGRWWGGEAAPAPAEAADLPKFAVIELNVRKDYRGRGIGKRLLEELLASQGARYATLLANPEAPAHAMYRRWGWQVVGTVRPAPDAMASDALILDLSKQ
ncbi:GNAT family N-acetyltransferase [Streptosporangium sp. NPDC001681]|uniref:GNAT family N-acetyltransferase n=1 Tax=Streptosporangium sp. NPDC001681 TaxID=3154395 RepID=UPI003328C2EC